MTHLRVDLDFDAFAHFVSDGLVYVGTDGLVAAWSATAAAVTGIGGADALGRSLDELFASVEPALGFAAVPEPLELWSSDEHRRRIHATVLSVDDGWLISFGPQQRYAAIDQLKNELIAAVSHELKTPIATIKAYATTMRMNPSIRDDERGEYLKTIEEEADRLGRAVEDLLRVGRVAAPHLLRERRAIALDEILDDIAARLGPSAAARIERRGTNVTIICDPDLAIEAIGRVIENALKFSADTTSVVVEATAVPGGARVVVRDRGIGIGAEHLPYIFERFYRVERSLTSTAGTGLGLSIVREIVHAHGGSITVESTPHEGSAFALHFPEGEAAAQ